MLDRLSEVLATPPGSRSPEAVQELKAATESTHLFQRLHALHDSDQVHRNSCQFMQCKQFKDGEEILSFGQQASRLCWILQGQVVAFAPQQVVAAHHLNVPNINIHQHTSPSVPVLDLPDVQDVVVKEVRHQLGLLQSFYQKELDEAGNMPRDAALVEAPHLAKRSCHGELGLLASLPSVYSLVALSDVTAIILTADDFYSAFGDSVEAECSQIATDLRKVALFKTWTKQGLAKVCEFFHVKRFRRNEAVFVEGDAAAYVYIIRAGEFKVSARQQSLRVRSPGRGERRLTANLSIKAPYDFLGVDEVIERRQTMSVTCECYSAKGELYYIRREVLLTQHFVDKILTRPESQQLLRARHQLHLNSLSQGTQQVQELETLKKTLELPTPRPTTTASGWMPYIRAVLSPKKLPPKHKEDVHIYETCVPSRRPRATYSRTEPVKTSAEFIHKHLARRAAPKPLPRRLAPPSFLLASRLKNDRLRTRMMVFGPPSE